MIESFSEFEKVFRSRVFEMAAPTDLFTFGLEHPDDASPNAAGNLFMQTFDFLLLETSIERAGRAGVGDEAPRRAWGTLLIGLVTTQTHNTIEAMEKLETAASWFRDQTIGGVRFRTFQPLGASPLRGRVSHDGVINFNFELLK